MARLSARHLHDVRTRTRLVVALLALTAACGGPPTGPDYALRKVPVDLAYGEEDNPTGGEAAAAPAPTKLAPRSLTLPGMFATPLPEGNGDVRAVAPRREQKTAPACPAADPLGAPAMSATVDVEGVPKEGSYAYRQTGSVRSGPALDAYGPAVAAESEMERKISNVSTRDVYPERGPIIDYDVTEFEGDVTRTISYRIDPGTVPKPDHTGALVPPEGAISMVRSRVEGARREAFEPVPPIRLMSLPAFHEAQPNGYVGTTRGSDANSAMTFEITSQTLEQERVDVCGVWHRGWKVKVSGYIGDRGVRRNMNITATMIFATQYGGLLLADDLKITGWDSGREQGQEWFEYARSTTINSIEPVVR